MSKITPIKIALQRFVAEIDGERIVVEEGERVIATHELVSRYPEHFRERGLEEELAIRAACVAEMRAQGTRPASSEPLSRAGRQEREEERFWRSVDRELHRDTRTTEERTEDAFYEQAIAQLERSDATRARDERIELNEMWAGRLEE